MPSWMMPALLAILVLYVWGYLGQRRKIQFRYPLMLLVGASFDWFTSLKMAPGLNAALSLHSLFALAGLFGMSVFAFLALVEYRLWRFHKRAAASRLMRINLIFGPVALLVWLGSLVTGLLIALHILPRL